MNIEVYSDGSATTKDRPGGWGYVIVIDGERHSEGCGYLPFATNNDAELEAAIQGLDQARFLAGENDTVTLVSDSQLVLGWVTGRYRFRQENKQEKFQQLLLLVKLLDVQTRWVQGHTGHEHNERCDELANQARLSGSSEVIQEVSLLHDCPRFGCSKCEPEKTATIQLVAPPPNPAIFEIIWMGKRKIIDLENNTVKDYTE